MNIAKRCAQALVDRKSDSIQYLPKLQELASQGKLWTSHWFEDEDERDFDENIYSIATSAEEAKVASERFTDDAVNYDGSSSVSLEEFASLVNGGFIDEDLAKEIVVNGGTCYSGS